MYIGSQLIQKTIVFFLLYFLGYMLIFMLFALGLGKAAYLNVLSIELFLFTSTIYMKLYIV